MRNKSFTAILALVLILGNILPGVHLTPTQTASAHAPPPPTLGAPTPPPAGSGVAGRLLLAPPPLDNPFPEV